MRGILQSLITSSRDLQPGRRKKRRSAFELPEAAAIGSGFPELLEARTLLASQLISSDAPIKTVAAGETVDIPIVYQTLDDNGATAALKSDLLNFNLHFDADVLTFVGTTDVFLEDISTQPDSAEAEASVIGNDNDAATETVLNAIYTDNTANGIGWPNDPKAVGLVLYVARFQARAGFTETTINFTSNETAGVSGTADNFTFRANSLTLQAPSGPTVSVSDANTVTEGGSANFLVSLSQESNSAVTLSYSTEEGNGPTGAIGGEDFVTQTDQSLTFAPGETQKTISVATINDSIIEPDETFGVNIFGITGATIRVSRGTGTIVDDDSGLPALSIANADAVLEGNSAAFVVTLDAAANNNVTVKYSTADGNGPTGATNGTDISALTDETLTFTPGQTQKTINVSTTNDGVAESQETFTVVLSDAVNATISRSQATGTITDNDNGQPILNIGDAPSVTEGSVSVFSVTLSESSTETVTLSYSTNDGNGPQGAVSGSDYDALNNLSLTFNPGETAKTISVSTLNDTQAEPTETFNVVISNAIGANINSSTGTATILDNDSAGQASGNIDGDGDFDANDAFLIHLVKLSGSDAQIDSSKGASNLTATQIRNNVGGLETPGDVDGDQDFDANDSFLIQLVKLAGSNAQIDGSKGSSNLSATQIRANVDALGPASTSSRQSSRRSTWTQPDTEQVSVNSLFSDAEGDSSATGAVTENDSAPSTEPLWEDFRKWIDAL